MHPVITAVIAAHGSPESIAGQDPQLPESNGQIARLAYWQSADKKARGLRTVCPTARYIARHWPDLKDHQIRDFVAAQAATTIVWATTTEAIVEAVVTGPHSCMSYPSHKFRCSGHHPYEAYNPGLGWTMALLYATDGDTRPTSRALVYTSPDTGERCYVRSYTHASTPPVPGAYGKPCTTLEAALSAAGVARAKSWPTGAEVEQIQLDDGSWLMPYIDGDHQNVADTGYDTFKIVPSGGHAATETTGRVGSSCYCEHCDQYVQCDDEDMVTAADGETICPDCAEHSYTLARVFVAGRRTQALVPNDDVSETTDGEVIRDADAAKLGYVQTHDGDYAPAEDCIQLHDGDYALTDDCTQLHDGDYALTDDCTRLHDGTYALTEVCIQLHDCDYALPDDCTQLHDGDYALTDDCTRLHDGTYALTDDCTELPDGDYALTEDCTELPDGTYALTDDCTQLHDGTYALAEDCTQLHDGTYALAEDCTELPDGYHRLTSAAQGYLALSA